MKILDNKIIIVTGGSGLIGKAIIKDIESNGGVAINADINAKTNPNKNQFKCDTTKRESIQELVNKVVMNYGRIDGLVNNAYPRTKDWGVIFEDIPPESWRKNVDMQMNSVFNFCQIVLSIMKQQQSGSIVNIASIYGVVGNDISIYEGTNITAAAAYSAIKGGIINFTRYLASYYGRQNVRVNCISPGGIFNNQDPTFVANYEKKVPMNRMGTPEDIAPPVSFLLSDNAKYITGHNLIVDGGWTAI